MLPVARHWDNPGARVYSFHLHQAVLRLWGAEHLEFLTVRFGTKTKNMASGIFLFTRVLGIGVRLYLGGAIMVVIWRYLFPSLPINLNTYIWALSS